LKVIKNTSISKKNNLKKFCYLARNISLVAVMTCLAMLSDATDFDPEKRRVPKDVSVLWDYGIQSEIDSNKVVDIKDEDLEHLATNVWGSIGLPKRFITEKQWQIYDKLATAAGIKLKATFAPAGNARIKTASNHFLKIKDLVKSGLKQASPQAFNVDGEKIHSINEFNGDSFISSTLFDHYLKSTDKLMGELPDQQLVRGNKMLSQENTILSIIHDLDLNPVLLPRRPDNSPYSSRLTIRNLAMQNLDLFPTKAVFHQSWYRLTKKGEIRYEDQV
jgi:hypothetical protein